MRFIQRSAEKSVESRARASKHESRTAHHAMPPNWSNQVMQQFLNARMIQAKLAISQPSDAHEQEADRVAAQVTRGSNAMPSPALQTKTVAGESSAAMAMARGGGHSIPQETRAFMESRLGYDFGAVRIHDDAHAAESARSFNALAYTYGQNIVFGAGQYSPNTRGGQQLIAHELTHVVQQRRGAKSVQRFTDAQCTASNCTPTSRCGIVDSDFVRADGYLKDAIAAMQPSPVAGSTERAIRWYFHRDGDTPDGAILRRLRLISQVLNTAHSTADFQCQPMDSGSCARGYAAFVATPRGLAPETIAQNTINLCGGKYFGSDARNRAEMLIHECAHLIGMSVHPQPDVYSHTQRFRTLSWEQALLNSDTFAFFCSGISQGVPVTLPFSFGAAGGVVSESSGEHGWFASAFVETTLQHPRLHIFNPTLRVSGTLIGITQSGQGTSSTLDVSLVYGLLPGFRLENPRPSGGGTGYLAVRAGPTLVLHNDIKIGAEAGVVAGYHWRWADIGIEATYRRDPTQPEGARDFIQIGPVITLTPTFLKGSHY